MSEEHEALIKENNELRVALAAEKEFTNMLVNRLGDRTVELKKAIREIAGLHAALNPHI